MVIYDTLNDDDQQIGVGLGCNGKIEVLFTPLVKSDTHNPVAILKSCLHRREPSVLIQMLQSAEDVGIRGRLWDAPQWEELSAIIGIPYPTLLAHQKAVLDKGKSEVVAFQNKKGVTYTLLFEYLRPNIRLLIAGDNYDVAALVQLATLLGWTTEVFGKRSKFSKTVFTQAAHVGDFDEMPTVSTDAFTAIVLMTHDLKRDQLLCLPCQQTIYVCRAVGTRKRFEKIKAFANIAEDSIIHTHWLRHRG
ncbi:MAG: XdhC family protein [Saprospiraceae bacterium]